MIAAGLGLGLLYFSNFVPKYETPEQNAARIAYESVGAAQVAGAGGAAAYTYAPTGYTA